jgi:hypothetical protein
MGACLHSSSGSGQRVIDGNRDTRALHRQMTGWPLRLALACLCGLGPVRAHAAEPAADSTKHVHYLRFNTGTDPGQRYPAVYCWVAPLGEQELGCWTPNDGYTILLPGLPISNGPTRPFRAPGHANYHRVLRNSHYLPQGVVEKYGVFTCVSRSSGLTCRNESGRGWLLPRYTGLPRIF